MYEQVICKECGELEVVQSLSDQWHQSLCTICLEEHEDMESESDGNQY